MNKSLLLLVSLWSCGVCANDWAPVQATGPANTREYGDHVTAWASATEDEQAEWLQLEFAEPVTPATLRVFESFNPGALRQVTALDARGQEITLWQGVDPLQGTSTVGVAELALQSDRTVQRLKLYLASEQVPGWNEIDAVELIAANGTRQWASQAIASSYYGDGSATESASADEPLQNQTNDEFSALLSQPLRLRVVTGEWVKGTLQHNGVMFIRLSVDGQQVLVNKAHIIRVELEQQTP